MHAAYSAYPHLCPPSALDLSLHTHWWALRWTAEHSCPLTEPTTSCLGPSSLEGDNIWFEYGRGQEADFQQGGRNTQGKDREFCDWTKQNEELVILDTERKTVSSTGLESVETRTWWPRYLSLDEKPKEWKIDLCSLQWSYYKETRKRERLRNEARKVYLEKITCTHYCILFSRVPQNYSPEKLSWSFLSLSAVRKDRERNQSRLPSADWQRWCQHVFAASHCSSMMAVGDGGSGHAGGPCWLQYALW